MIGLARLNDGGHNCGRATLELVDIDAGIKQYGLAADPVLRCKRQAAVFSTRERAPWIKPRPANGAVKIELNHI